MKMGESQPPAADQALLASSAFHTGASAAPTTPFGCACPAGIPAGTPGATPVYSPTPAVAPMAAQPQREQPISKAKAAVPKLSIKRGDITTITHLINEWAQKMAFALNTWSMEAVNFWHLAVNAARQEHANWVAPLQIPVLEATMRSELISSVLQERAVSAAMRKGTLTLVDLLYLTFQMFLPSKPAARVDGLNSVAKLFNSLKVRVSSLISSDNAFATEASQMYRIANIKTSCTDKGD